MRQLLLSVQCSSRVSLETPTIQTKMFICKCHTLNIPVHTLMNSYPCQPFQTQDKLNIFMIVYRFMERVFIFCLLYSRRLAVQVTEMDGSRHRGSAVAKIN